MSWFDQAATTDVEVLPATIAHAWYHSGASGSRLSHVEDERLLLHENFTDTWWEEAESESSAPQRFCQKCLYANDSMSDNLQSQLLIFKPPDRMSLFISSTFNTPCFTV